MPDAITSASSGTAGIRGQPFLAARLLRFPDGREPAIDTYRDRGSLVSLDATAAGPARLIPGGDAVDHRPARPQDKATIEAALIGGGRFRGSISIAISISI